MMKIIVEFDDIIIGRKDKMAFDVHDFISMINEIVHNAFNIEDDEELVIRKKLPPSVPVGERAATEGM